MATEKTPTHKRIKRAETGRDDWKVKALERREENEKLKHEIESKESRLSELTNLNLELKETLKAANKKITEQENLIECFKKKSFK